MPAQLIAMPPKAGTRRTATRRTEGSEATSTPATGAETTQNAPESRDVSAQSATPGPSGRPSVQRLQSLKTRGGSGSIAPKARPTSALGGEPAKPALKYKPRNAGRRSKEERDAIEKLEAERNSERLKEAAAIQRGRGGRGGRGSFRGRGGPAGMAASGLFGSGMGGARRGRGGGGGSGGGGGYGGSSRDRTRSVLSAGPGHAQLDDDSDEDDSTSRLDINYINELDDDEDFDNLPQDVKGKLPFRPKSDGLKPYRVHRIEHEERVVSVNMESSSSRSAELRKKAEAEKAADQGEITPVEEGEGESHVKDEPVDDNDTTMVDAVPHAEDDGFLPAQNVRVRRKVPPSPQKPKSKRTEPIELEPELARDPRELLRTKEEIDEYDRHLEDLDHVRNLLFYEEPENTETATETTATEPQMAETAEGESTTVQGDDADEGEKEDEDDKTTNPKLLGQLFLMQFPPMTPNLTVPGSTTQPSTTPAPAAPGQTEIKTEDDVQVVDADAPTTETPKVITAATDWALPAGRAGKLNVHKSGRVTMDWGGISFELDRAAAVDFVQEALIVSSPEPDLPGQPPKDESEQRAWSMGQLSGKFTVMPNWDQML